MEVKISIRSKKKGGKSKREVHRAHVKQEDEQKKKRKKGTSEVSKSESNKADSAEGKIAIYVNMLTYVFRKRE
jgi:hypothetical protein